MTKEKAVKGKTEKNVREAEVVSVGVPAQVAVYQQQQQSVENMIMKAIEQGVDVSVMERVLAMRTQLKAEYAKEQFDNAMADFQAGCPVIRKTKLARDNEKNKDLYSYAPIEEIVEQTKELIGRYGFSYSFKTENEPAKVKVTCIVKHRDGHSEESTMETALATKTNIMSAPQQIAATVTFNKRYAFMNAFGITTGGEDDEKQLPKDTVAPQPKTQSLATIRQMIKDAKLDESVIAGKFNVATIEDLDERNLKVLEKSLLQKLGKDYIPTIVQE